MTTVLEEYTTEEQLHFMGYFCGQNELMQMIIVKEYFQFTV
jgi:hypothetical protein